MKTILITIASLVLLASCSKPEPACRYSCEYRQYENGKVVYRSTGYQDEIRICSETPNTYVSGSENFSTYYRPDGSTSTTISGVYCTLK